jgi:hypothetical protein
VLFTIAVYALTQLCGGRRAAIIAALLSVIAPASCCGSRYRPDDSVTRASS